MKTICAILCVFSLNAEYNGENIDGQEFVCSAYSYSTGKYYEVTVEFDGNEVVLTFNNGNTVTLGLDDEVIEDPSSIEAYDYNRAVYWDLEVRGLE